MFDCCNTLLLENDFLVEGRFKMKISKMFLISLLMFRCGDSSVNYSEAKFDSAHTIALDGYIEEGIMYSSSNSKTVQRDQIRSQLMYSIGQLNGEKGGTDANRFSIEIKNSELQSELGLYQVSYTAKLFIAWPNERSIPENYEMLLPKRSDSSGLEEFFKIYGDEEDRYNCLDSSAHDPELNVFWYYYRPHLSKCKIERGDDQLIVRVPVYLSKSDENTLNKSPEYHKIWEDGRFVATVIFAKNELDGKESDVGTLAYNELYKSLNSRYGEPFESNVDINAFEVPSIKYPELRLKYKTLAGDMEVNMFLISGIRNAGFEFTAKYNELTRYSDYVSYNGHSGLGANIRSLAAMGRFEPKQYQVFLVNGCDTFAYVDHALAAAHQRVNPDFGPNKFIDVITNAMPAYFSSLARSNIAVISALVDQEKSYREILAGFSSSQRAVVTGEEDND